MGSNQSLDTHQTTNMYQSNKKFKSSSDGMNPSNKTSHVPVSFPLQDTQIQHRDTHRRYKKLCVEQNRSGGQVYQVERDQIQDRTDTYRQGYMYGNTNYMGGQRVYNGRDTEVEDTRTRQGVRDTIDSTMYRQD